jgi:hypothetical protein
VGVGAGAAPSIAVLSISRRALKARSIAVRCWSNFFMMSLMPFIVFNPRRPMESTNTNHSAFSRVFLICSDKYFPIEPHGSLRSPLAWVRRIRYRPARKHRINQTLNHCQLSRRNQSQEPTAGGPGKRQLKETDGTADLLHMLTTIRGICDPELYRLDDSIQQARSCAQTSPRFEFDLVRFLQAQCLSNDVTLPKIYRGIEVLGAIADDDRLITLLRPFLRTGDARIASKCVMILGQESKTVSWFKSVRGESDDRVRANLIQSIWKRKEPEAEQLLRNAVKDPHHRVAANAVYGLYLAGSDLYAGALEALIRNPKPAFRRAAIWVIRSSGAPEAAYKLRSLISDTDAGVRQAAFAALVYLRDRAAAPQ